MAETIIDTLVTEFVYRTNKDQLKDLDSRLDKVQSGLRAASGLFTAIGTAAVGAFTYAAKAAIDWEDSFTGVRKTVTATEEEFAQLEEELKQLALTDVPLHPEELAAVAESAGQLGIETPNIISFTKVMAQLGATTNLSSEQAATGLARFANIVQMPQDRFDRLGSTVVNLGNNLATTEAEIVDMGLRLAGAGKLVGLTEHQILGMAGALSSVGLESEAGGTAFSRVLADMQAAVQSGSEELTTFAKIAGVTRERFQFEFGRDAVGATTLFLQGLKRMVDGGENVHVVLEELGFDAVRVRDSLLRSSGSIDLFTESLLLAEDGWNENNALMREAELRFGTTKSLVEFLKSAVYLLRVEVGDALLPTIQDLIGRLRDIAGGLREWVRENPRAVRALALLSLGALALGGFLFGASIMVGVLRRALAVLAFFSETEVFRRIARAGVVAFLRVRAAMMTLVTTNVFTLLSTGARVAFAKIAGYGMAAALAIQRMWIRTLLTIRFGGLVGLARTAFSSIATLGVTAFRRLMTGALFSLGAIKGAAIAVWTVMTGGAIWAVIGIAALLIAAWKPVSTFFSGLWEGFKSTIPQISDAFSGLLDALGPIGSGIRGVFSWIGEGVSWLAGLFGDWSESGKSWGESIGGAVVVVINKLAELAGWVRNSWIVRKLLGDPEVDGEGSGTVTEGVTPSRRMEGPQFAGTPGLNAASVYGDVASGAYAAGLYHAPPTAIVPPSGAVNTNRRTDIRIDRIEIQTPNGDPETIASSIDTRLVEMLHNTAEDFDDDFSR